MSDAIAFADGYREFSPNTDRRWWQFWKPRKVFGPLVPYLPKGWELWDDEQARAIMARPDVIYPLIINRSDEPTAIGTYIQWAPRDSDG